MRPVAASSGTSFSIPITFPFPVAATTPGAPATPTSAVIFTTFGTNVSLDELRIDFLATKYEVLHFVHSLHHCFRSIELNKAKVLMKCNLNNAT